MGLRLLFVSLSIALAAIFAGSAMAQDSAPAFETKAERVFMIDADTGAVLFAKDPDTAFTPASLAKLMTMEIVFEALKTGEVSEETGYKISEHAWRTGGAPSRTAAMFAPIHSTVPLAGLMKGVTVMYANDASIAIAEGMAGSEAAFAERMNRRAAELGLTGTAFVNPTGLPAPGQKTTARDLAMLALHVLRDHREAISIYSVPQFTWNNITQQNRNPLFKAGLGVDGFVAGFAEDAGFGIVATVLRGDRRLIVAASGMPTDKDRIEETRKLIEWGMNEFTRVQLFAGGEAVGEASVYGGEASRVPVAGSRPIAVLIRKGEGQKIRARVQYRGPLIAPVRKGDEVGRLVIADGELTLQQAPLFAAADVEVGGLSKRTLDALYELAFGWLR